MAWKDGSLRASSEPSDGGELDSEETLDVEKGADCAADSDALQCEKEAATDKNGLVVEEGVHVVNDETEKGRDCDHKQKNNEDYVPAVSSGASWPCSDIGDDDNPPTSEWPSFKLPLVDDLVSNKDAAELKILEDCHGFFLRMYGPEYNEEEDQWEWMDEEEEEGFVEEEDDDELIDGECEEFHFFMKLFTENENLRRYYETRHGDGDFLCLVCGAVRKKAWRRFKGCLGLLLHSNTIWMVKKKAHRAYARVVCKVLGWDNEALPKIVRSTPTLGQSLANSPGAQDSTLLPASDAEGPCKDMNNNSNAPTSVLPKPKDPSDPLIPSLPNSRDAQDEMKRNDQHGSKDSENPNPGENV